MMKKIERIIFLLIFAISISFNSKNLAQCCKGTLNGSGGSQGSQSSGGTIYTGNPGSGGTTTNTGVPIPGKNTPKSGGGGRGDGEFYDVEDYGDDDDWGGDSYGDEFYGGSGTFGGSNCFAKALSMIESIVTWENYAQNMGMTNLQHTGVITPFQRQYFKNNLPLLCNERLLKIAIKATEVIENCVNPPQGKDVDDMMDYFYDPNLMGTSSTMKILNCHYSKKIGQTFADCVFPVGGNPPSTVTNYNVFALEEYVKANPKDKDWVNVNGCEVLKSIDVMKIFTQNNDADLIETILSSQDIFDMTKNLGPSLSNTIGICPSSFSFITISDPKGKDKKGNIYHKTGIKDFNLTVITDAGSLTIPFGSIHISIPADLCDPNSGTPSCAQILAEAMNLAFDDVQARIDGTLTTLNGNLLTPILTSQDVKAAYLAHIQHRLNNYAPHHSGRTFLVTMPNKLQKNTYLSEGIKFIEPTTSQECK